MLKLNRQLQIEEELKRTGSIIISDISSKIGCSEETIRRDLKEMENKKLLKRVRGGAFLPDLDDKGVPFKLREQYFFKEKEIMSKYVVKELINENDSIMLDSSTTSLNLARKILESNLNVTIITNSLRIMTLYNNQPQRGKLICIGGIYRKKACSFVGYQSTEAISNYMADKCFISSSALSIQHGMLDNNQNESQVRKAFLTYSKKKILIVDHTKFNDSADYIIAPLTEVDEIVTNIKPNKEWIAKLKRFNIKLTCVE